MVKDLSLFSKDCKNKTGRRNYCMTCDRTRNKTYYRLNPDKAVARGGRRRAVKLNAQPGWANDAAIARVYKAAKDLERITGLEYHVDHIVPLQSKLVCGLHCEANLRVLPAAVNLAKGNSTWPDMP